MGLSDSSFNFSHILSVSSVVSVGNYATTPILGADASGEVEELGVSSFGDGQCQFTRNFRL